MSHHQHSSHSPDFHDHEHTVKGELVHHLPYAIFSVAFALSILSICTFWARGFGDPVVMHKGFKMLFHSFHFMHLVFAATGTIVMFRRFSHNVLWALIIGTLSPVLFCTLSDSVLPYLGGRALGVDMHFHMCFITEIANVIPFLVVGIINGWVLSSHHTSKQGFYSVFSHAIHIFVSSLAATFYLVAHGFTDWYHQIGAVFVFILVAVVIPCTLSDIVVPMAFAKARNKHEKH